MQTASEMLRAAALIQARALKGGAQSNSSGSRGSGRGRPTQKETEKQNKAVLSRNRKEREAATSPPATSGQQPQTAPGRRAATPSCGEDPRWPKPSPSPGLRTKARSEADLLPGGCLDTNSTKRGLGRAQSAQRFGGGLRRGGSSWLCAPPLCACARAVVLVPGRYAFCSLRGEGSLALHLEFI